MISKQTLIHGLIVGAACGLLTACGSQQTSITGAPRNKMVSKPQVGEAELKRALNASLDVKSFTPLWFKPLEVLDKLRYKEFLYQKGVYQKGISKRRSDGAVLIIETWIASSPVTADDFAEGSIRHRALLHKKNGAGRPVIGDEVWRAPAEFSPDTKTWPNTRAIIFARQGRAVAELMLLAKAQKDKSGRSAAKPLSVADYKFIDTQAIATLRQLKQAGFTE